MPDQTLITVRGEAELEVEPELAVLGLTIAARDRDRSHAVELVAGRVREIAEAIRGYGEAIHRLESQPVRVQPLFAGGEIRKGDFRPGTTRTVTRTIGYLAQAGFAVMVGDFAVLGELVGTLATEDLVTLNGPTWQLRPDSPVHREVRLAAAKDSIIRARDYAEAFGGEITGLAEAADTGLLSGNAGTTRVMAAGASIMRRARKRPSDEAVEIDIIPEVQTVYAQVEARFLMSQPTLGR